jgi:hypothetical protein
MAGRLVNSLLGPNPHKGQQPPMAPVPTEMRFPTRDNVAGPSVTRPQESLGDVPKWEQSPIATESEGKWQDSPVEMSWVEVGELAISNTPESAQQFLKDIWNAVRHPIETGGTLLDVADGAIRLMAPGGDSPNEDKARAVGQFFSNRYGTVDGFKVALATDPVGVLGDLSVLFTGGGAAGARLPGIAGQTARAARTVGRAIDPTLIAAKGVQKAWTGGAVPFTKNARIPGVSDAITGPLGAWSGTGAAPIERGAQAGAAGGRRTEAVLEGLREPAALERIVIKAENALDTIKKNASDAYLNDMKAVAEHTKELDFNKIDKAFSEISEQGKFKGRVIAPATQEIVEKIQKILDEWRAMDPKDYHTATGLDALKKEIWDAGAGISWDHPSKIVVNKVYHAIKDEIVKQAPLYGKAMKNYELVKKLVADVQRSLSVGNKSATDTALRKLTSVMRNNVNTNYGRRLSLAETLDQAGDGTLVDQIAGAAMSSPTPRGIQGATSPAATVGLAAGAYEGSVPLAAVAASGLASSPRIIGEGAVAGGRVVGAADRFLKSPIGRRTVGSSGARMTTQQMGRLERDLREKGLLR